MGEESFFWDGITTGDAVYAPYSAATYREVWRRLVSPDDTNGIIRAGLGVQAFLDYGTYVKAQIAPGAGIVRGVMYVSDEPVFFNLNKPPSGSYYYAIVLRYFANAVRLALLGPSTTGYPALTQTNTQYEILVNYITMPTGASPVVNRFDTRIPLNDRGKVVSNFHMGGNADDFTVAGTTGYAESRRIGVQIGVKRWSGGAANSGNVAITFPRAFAYNPIVIATTQKAHGDYSSKIHCRPTVEGISTTGATIYWMVPSGTHTQIDFEWMAAGIMNSI